MKTMSINKRIIAFAIALCVALSLSIFGCAANNSVSSSSSSSSSANGTSASQGAFSEGSQSSSAALDQSQIDAIDGIVRVSVTIDPSAAIGLIDDSVDTTVISVDELEFEEGSTAFDALSAMNVAITGDSSYVTGINGLKAGDAGATSGWMYFVNGEMPNVASNEYSLQNGDSVEWRYVTAYEG